MSSTSALANKRRRVSDVTHVAPFRFATERRSERLRQLREEQERELERLAQHAAGATATTTAASSTWAPVRSAAAMPLLATMEKIALPGVGLPSFVSEVATEADNWVRRRRSAGAVLKVAAATAGAPSDDEVGDQNIPPEPTTPFGLHSELRSR